MLRQLQLLALLQRVSVQVREVMQRLREMKAIPKSREGRGDIPVESMGYRSVSCADCLHRYIREVGRLGIAI